MDLNHSDVKLQTRFLFMWSRVVPEVQKVLFVFDEIFREIKLKTQLDPADPVPMKPAAGKCDQSFWYRLVLEVLTS